jgi:zinc protease
VKRVSLVSLLSCTAFALAAFACGGAPPPLHPPPAPPEPAPSTTVTAPVPDAPVTPDAAFRGQPPAPGPAAPFVAPKIVEAKLKNGIRVLLVERHDLPIVSVRVVLKSGASDLMGDRPEVMTFAGSMLAQGTKKRSALELSDAFDAIGASYGAYVGQDSGGADVKVLAQELDKGLELLADVVQNPAFDAAEIERLRARWLGWSQQQRSQPGTLVQSALAASLFGAAHPYGKPPILKEEQIKKITKDEAQRAYARAFTAGNAAICVAGDITKDALLPKLEASFGGWKGAAPARTKIAPPVPAKDAPRLVLVDRPGAPQSQVQVAEVGVPFATPDRDAIVVMNAILGGMFSSRINLNLREKHAYTYGARSGFAMRHGAGPFTAGAAILADKTAPAIHELFTELGGIRETEVSAEELAGAKESIRLAMPARFETVGAVTDALADLVVHDLPSDEYDKRSARIDAVTAADVKKAAQAHLHPQKMKVIVVGDRKALGESLESLHMGAAEVRDAYGDLVK